MHTHLDYDVARRLFALAITNGASRLSSSHNQWDLAEDCAAPVYRDLVGRPYVDNPAGTFLRTELTVRCRTCEQCLAARRRQWTGRAIRECSAAYRTWTGNMTLRPEAHYQMLAQACKRLRIHGRDFDVLTPSEQFAQRHMEISREITRYVKRVRKASGLLRLLLVAESHKSGLPHYHMLWHEKDLIGTREKVLADQWKLGFSHWRLIADNRQATYICKYLGKELGARVRASQFYGQDVLGHSALEHMRVTTNDHQKVVYDASGHICVDGGRSPRIADFIGTEP